MRLTPSLKMPGESASAEGGNIVAEIMATSARTNSRRQQRGIRRPAPYDLLAVSNCAKTCRPPRAGQARCQTGQAVLKVKPVRYFRMFGLFEIRNRKGHR